MAGADGGCGSRGRHSPRASAPPVANRKGLIGSTSMLWTPTLAEPLAVTSCRWSAAVGAVRCQEQQNEVVSQQPGRPCPVNTQACTQVTARSPLCHLRPLGGGKLSGRALTNDASLAGASAWGPNVNLVGNSILPAGKETICNTCPRLNSPGFSHWHRLHGSLWLLCRLGQAAGCLWHRSRCSRHWKAPRR